jgi:hypothetical protein
MGMPSGPLAWAIPCLVALGLLGFGALGTLLSVSSECSKCGRAVCRRCDRELGTGSTLCAQCVNVFSRKGVVAPQVKVRKMIEVDRHRTRTERTSWILGIFCSGAGHLFSGEPLRGALFALWSLFLVALVVFRDGVLRSPWDGLPVWLWLVPVGLALALTWVLSLNSLRKTHAR